MRSSAVLEGERISAPDGTGREPVSNKIVCGFSSHGAFGLQGTNRGNYDTWKGCHSQLFVEAKGEQESSTETELFRVDGAISNILRSLYFMQEQGVNTTHAMVYQTTRVQYYWSKMAKFPASNVLSTSKQSISS